jgi:hypothetical protein
MSVRTRSAAGHLYARSPRRGQVSSQLHSLRSTSTKHLIPRTDLPVVTPHLQDIHGLENNEVDELAVSTIAALQPRNLEAARHVEK